MTPQHVIEQIINKYGETYRRIITDAITWLDQTEPKWELDEPSDRFEYAAAVIERVAKNPDGSPV